MWEKYVTGSQIINKDGLEESGRYSAPFLYMKENDRKISEWYNEEKTGDGLGLVVSNKL